MDEDIHGYPNDENSTTHVDTVDVGTGGERENGLRRGTRTRFHVMLSIHFVLHSFLNSGIALSYLKGLGLSLRLHFAGNTGLLSVPLLCFVMMSNIDVCRMTVIEIR